jgi:hypothetical protein
MVTAFNEFKEENPISFAGQAQGVYLSNRLENAFQAGWNANESLWLDRLASWRGEE